MYAYEILFISRLRVRACREVVSCSDEGWVFVLRVDKIMVVSAFSIDKG